MRLQLPAPRAWAGCRALRPVFHYGLCCVLWWKSRCTSPGSTYGLCTTYIRPYRQPTTLGSPPEPRRGGFRIALTADGTLKVHGRIGGLQVLLACAYSQLTVMVLPGTLTGGEAARWLAEAGASALFVRRASAAADDPCARLEATVPGACSVGTTALPALTTIVQVPPHTCCEPAGGCRRRVLCGCELGPNTTRGRISPQSPKPRQRIVPCGLQSTQGQPCVDAAPSVAFLTCHRPGGSATNPRRPSLRLVRLIGTG
jgi:hypothetical protein